MRPRTHRLHPFHVVTMMHQIASRVRMMHPELTWDRRGAMASATGATANVKAACVHYAMLEKCQAYGGGNIANGCEVIWDQTNQGCYVVTDSIDHGSGDENHLCWVFPDSNGDFSYYKLTCSDILSSSLVDICIVSIYTSFSPPWRFLYKNSTIRL